MPHGLEALAVCESPQTATRLKKDDALNQPMGQRPPSTGLEALDKSVARNLDIGACFLGDCQDVTAVPLAGPSTHWHEVYEHPSSRAVPDATGRFAHACCATEVDWSVCWSALLGVLHRRILFACCLGPSCCPSLGTGVDPLIV